MTDFTIRSDSVDVEQIMRQIRARIREKRGVDYTEDEIRELANVKLEKFLDPRGVRSDLLQQFRSRRTPQQPPPNFAFEDSTLFESHRAIIRWIRAVLKPILKLFFNPNPLIQALHIQSELNARNAHQASEYENREALHYEVIHNLVLEITRLGIEVKNLKMRLESMSSRLDFDERRARALEGVVQYRPGAVAPLQPPPSAAGGGGPREAAQPAGPDSAERRSRRRRRRGRKRPSSDAGRPEAVEGRPGQSGFIPDSSGGSEDMGRSSAADEAVIFDSSHDDSGGAPLSETPQVRETHAPSEPGGAQPSTPARGATSGIEGQGSPPFER